MKRRSILHGGILAAITGFFGFLGFGKCAEAGTRPPVDYLAARRQADWDFIVANTGAIPDYGVKNKEVAWKLHCFIYQWVDAPVKNPGFLVVKTSDDPILGRTTWVKEGFYKDRQLEFTELLKENPNLYYLSSEAVLSRIGGLCGYSVRKDAEDILINAWPDGLAHQLKQLRLCEEASE